MATSFIVHSGNTAKKYALFNDGVCMLDLHYECTEHGCSLTMRAVNGKQVHQKLSQSEFDNAFVHASAEAISHIKNSRLDDVEHIVLRVQIAGTYFQQHRQITSAYIQKLKNKEKTDPRQVLSVLRELKFCKKIFPEAEIYAASDTAFHATLPPHAREYSLSAELSQSLDVYKFGINGLSVSSVVRRIHAVIGLDPERVVVCHLGNSMSVTAVSKGQSIDTSVGFGPASGFPSGSQAGDIDITAGLHIMKCQNLRPVEGELFFNNQGGLQAMAGTSDIQILLKSVDQNDQLATHALKLLTYKIQQSIATSIAALGGVDVLIFTGTLGVRSPELRSRILHDLTYVPVQINDERNNAMTGKDGVISERNSTIKVVVLKGDQMSEINSVVQEVRLNSVKETSTR